MKLKKGLTLSFVVALTILFSWSVGYLIEKDMRYELLQQTQIAANAIDINSVKNLTGTSADLTSPDYLRLKQQFANIKKANKNLYFVYLMGVNKEGEVFFYVDDKPDGHPEGSAPGSSYSEAPKEFVEVMQSGVAVVEGPSKDSWGSFASGCAPIIDTRTGKVIAIFAIDFVTQSWYLTVISWAAIPVGLIVALMFVIISILVLRNRGKLLKNSEEKYRFMFHNNPQPNWIYDVETLSFLEVNEAAIQHYGYSEEEFLSMTLKDIRPVEDIPGLIEDMKKTNRLYNNAGEWRHLKKNGQIIFVEIISHAVTYNGKDARHVLVHDITDRKIAEEELRMAKNELENLHNNLDEAIFSFDLIHKKMRYVSKAHISVFGHSPAEFFENPDLWYDIVIPEDKPIVDAGYPVLNAGKNLSHEFRILHTDGQIRWIGAKLNPTLDENGKLIRIDGVASDITQRKRIEVELKESELNFRRSISESPVGIRIVTLTGLTIYVNQTFLDIFEYNSLEEFINTSAKSHYTPESYIQHQERKQKRKVGDEISDYEISIICKNNNIRYIKVSRKEMMWNGTKHYQVINIDVTEQRIAEEQLRKLSKAVEQSPNAVCITNPNAIIEYVNPKTVSLTGYSNDELINQNARIFSSGEKPKEEYAQMWKTIKSGKIWMGELHNKKKNGELYWEFTTISPIFDSNGQITHFLAIKEDITERKRIEMALYNSEMELRKFASHLQNVREEEKVALAREIHDELGQILVALKIEMGLLKQKVVKNNSFYSSDDILNRFDRLVSLIDKTIKTTRRIMNGLRPELLEMHGILEAIKAFISEFEVRHQISCNFTYDINDAEMNQQQQLALYRILQEALNNIAKHSKATLVTIQLIKVDNTLKFEIIDNGIGFDINNSGRPDSYGMIGMKERVVLLEGKLNITSEKDKGTTVSIEMPLVLPDI